MFFGYMFEVFEPIFVFRNGPEPQPKRIQQKVLNTRGSEPFRGGWVWVFKKVQIVFIILLYVIALLLVAAVYFQTHSPVPIIIFVCLQYL